MKHHIPNIIIDGQSLEDALQKTKTKLKSELKLQLNKDGLKKHLYTVAKKKNGDSQTEKVPIDDKYIEAIKNGKIVYTCNSGWIDKTHAFTDTKRTDAHIGVRNLWKQIVCEEGTKSNSPNEEGFLVTYGQDATVIQNIPLIDEPFRVGKTKKYFVKAGLSIKQKERVALAIFQEVSMEFESFQALGVVIGKGDSSFEPADLVSNLIGFYRIVRPELTKEIILALSNPLTIGQSIEVYKQNPGTFSDEKYKNKEFKPKYFPNNYCNKSTFPKELQTITPIKKGDLFRDWLPIFDIYGGKPPMRGSKL